MEPWHPNQVKTIWAIGRNYSEHSKEMNAEVPKEPVVFIKSPSTLTLETQLHLPPHSQRVDHEIEIAIRLNKQKQPSHIALALDLTARDIQTELKEKSLPWALAKSFPGSCPIGPWIPFESESWFLNLQVELQINGKTCQSGHTKDMLFSPHQILQFLSSRLPLAPGDIILTGTPSGVGPLRSGDTLEAHIKGLTQQSWNIC